MSGHWPVPADSSTVRIKKCARAYREELMAAAPERCATMDTRMREWGEVWMLPRMMRFNDDDWLGVKDAAEYLYITVSSLRNLRLRGHLTGRVVNGHWEYQVRELMRRSQRARSESADVGRAS